LFTSGVTWIINSEHSIGTACSMHLGCYKLLENYSILEVDCASISR